MIEESIKKAIDENLSAEVGKRLQARLEIIDALESDLADARASLESKDNTIRRLNAQLQDLEYIKETKTQIEVKLAALEKQRAVSEMKENMVDQMLQQNMELVKAVFSNRQITRVTHWDGQIPIADNNGYISQQYANGSITTTEDEK